MGDTIAVIVRRDLEDIGVQNDRDIRRAIELLQVVANKGITTGDLVNDGLNVRVR